MKEIILTVPHNTKEFIQSSMRWHQMISSFKEDTPNNEVHVFIKEEYSNATEQDLYAGVNLYGVDEQTILSPKGIAHIAKSGAPYSAVFDYVTYNIKDKHTQESILEALNEEGIKHNYNFWFTSLPTARSLELMIAIGSDSSYLLNNIMSYYNTEHDDECIDLLKVVLSNEGNANISGLYNIPSFLPTNAIEFLIETGLSINLVFNAAAGAQSLDNQSRLIKIAQNHGFSEQDFEKYFFSLSSLTTDFIDTVINTNLISAQKILQKIISLTTTEYCQETTGFIKSQGLIEKQAVLTKHTVSKGAKIEEVTFYTPDFVQDHSQLIIDLCTDLNSFPWDFESTPKQTIELLIEKGVDPDKLVKAIYDLSLPKYNHQINTHESATINVHLEELIGVAVKYHFDLNNYFTEQLSKKCYYTSLSGKMVPIVPSAEILKLLNQSKLVTADVLLYYAYEHNDLNLLKEAISKGAIIPLNEASNLLNKFISQGNYALAEYFVFELGIHDIDPRVYIGAVLSSDLENAQYIIKKFSQFFDRATCIELMRAAGASVNNIIIVSDIYDLYCAYGKNNTDLTPFARMLLNPTIELTADQLQDQDFTNKWGYSALQLAVLAGKLALAIELLEAGHDIYQTNNNHTSTIDLFTIISSFNSGEPNKECKELANKIATQLKEVDIVDKENGESLVDLLISTGSKTAEKIIALSDDPLFALYKKGVDFSNLFKDGLTHIAISNGDDFWSTGAWSTARLLMQNYPNVVFHLITLDMVTKAGVEFLDQFDAFINPGANDSYPSHKTFKLEDCPLTHPIEKLYQIVLTKATENQAPYLGMCAGAQHLVLNYKGTLEPLKGYNHGQHDITYIKGTIPYYMTLTKEQQSQMLKSGFFPNVTFKGDTAHNYAAVNNKLGQLSLGAISEDGVPMAYSSHIHFATQFHPEHFYWKQDENAKNQKAWLNNFVELAVMNHNGEDLIQHMQSVYDQMQELLGQTSADIF